MGTQFFWFYDIMLVLIILGITFKCFKKGFMSSILELLALAVAFVAALYCINNFAENLYDRFLHNHVEKYVGERIEESLQDNSFTSFSMVDTDAIIVNGKNITDIKIDFDPTGKTTLNLDNVDLTGTGVENVPLLKDTEKYDFSSLDLGKLVVNRSNLQDATVSELVFAKAIIQLYQGEGQGGAIKAIEGVVDTLTDNFSFAEINSSDLLTSAVVSMVRSSNTGFVGAVANDLVKPVLLVIFKTIIFTLVFMIVFGILMIISRALRGLKRVPIIGPINSLFGFIVGLAESAVIVIIIANIIHIITAITGNTIVFLNDIVIENTILFKYFYNFGFANFLK